MSEQPRILVMTDHPHMFDYAQSIFAKIEVRPDYAHSPLFGYKNTVLFGEGCLDVKKQHAEIAREYDLVFSIHCKQIFPPELVHAVRCINLHPGFNPYNRGWYPSQFSISDGQPAGATLHEIDKGIDTGDIIAQETVDVEPWDTSESVYEKIMQLEIRMLTKWLPAIIDGDYVAKPPDNTISKYNSRLDHARLCKLDMNEQSTIGQTIDRLRALSHGDYKNAYFTTEDGDKVWVGISLEREERL